MKDATLTYYKNGEFTESDIKRFADECVKEILGEEQQIDISGLNILHRNNKRTFSIQSIEDIKGVNALSSGQKISFGENGVTVVYGENGSEKSGYIRIFKQLADAKYKEELKENIYKSEKLKQTCRLNIRVDGKDQGLECDLTKNGQYELLKEIDIFDTKISKAYVETAKEASYEPWVFTLFSAIAKIILDIKQELENRKYEKFESEIVFPLDLRETDVANKIKNFNEKTHLEDSMFTWNEEDEQKLEEKEKNVNVDTIRLSVKSLRQESEQLTSLISYLAKFQQFYLLENSNVIKEKQDRLNIAKEQYEATKLFFSKSVDKLDEYSISNKAWISLWESAKKYHEEVMHSQKNDKVFTSKWHLFFMQTNY